MEFYYVRFFVVWICWLIFADKTRWREILPVSLFAGYLGLSTDVLNAHDPLPLWQFDYNATAFTALSDDWGTYLVSTYLFIQWLPKTQCMLKKVAYWFSWTTFAITLEWIHLKLGHMTYNRWWTLWHSYFADWFLYWLMYEYHKVFHFDKLSPRASSKKRCTTK